MPADREIHLGFIGPQAIYNTIDALGLAVLDWHENPTTTNALRAKPFELFEFEENSLATINDALEEAHKAVAARLGWTYVGQSANNYATYDTPFGRRETGCFSLCLVYDEDEIGDEPEDATIGVNLSSRYFPTLLDIESPHGALGSVIDFDALVPQIAICREEIVKRLPVFGEAKVFFREIFY